MTNHTPILKEIPTDNPVHRIVSPLMAVRNGREEQVSGTAFVIGRGYALTASHVLADFVEKYEGVRDVNSHLNISFEMLMFLRFNGGETILPIKVLRTWYSTPFDIAILALGIPQDWPDDHRWCVPQLSLLPPRVGTSIAAVGFANSELTHKPESTIPIVNLHPRVAPGRVEMIHHEKRDSMRMPFPCFQTDAKFDGGMSGGPIFDQTGHVCGIVCSNMPPSSPGEAHVSYGSSLWPIVATLIDASGASVATGEYYPALNLFKSGAIIARDLENVSIAKTENGLYRASVRYDANAFDNLGTI